MTLSEYRTPRLWQPIGAETSALWRADRTGLERASGNFNATRRDLARLGTVLANDGVRPDDPQRRQIIPRDCLLEATDWHRVPEAWQPGKAQRGSAWGYGYQFWLVPSEKRRFAFIGVFGQMMFVDPELKLVMAQTAADAVSHPAPLARDALALWKGVVRQYGSL
jgi:CubicO group peptidase (beta-lactamase class C family)